MEVDVGRYTYLPKINLGIILSAKYQLKCVNWRVDVRAPFTVGW